MNFNIRRYKKIRAELTSGDMPAVLSKICDAGIDVSGIHYIDALTCQFEVDRKLWGTLETIINKSGDKLTKIRESTAEIVLNAMHRHRILIAEGIMLTFLFLFLPTRILFLEVQGNEDIPETSIIELAYRCGLTPGVPRKKVRSERIKNEMIDRFPKLKWVGITTGGCVARIQVKPGEQEETVKSAAAGDIVGAIDGIVDSVTVRQGTSQCEPGMTVQQGDVLISGKTDVGLCVLSKRARGEIFARTIRTFHAVMPAFFTAIHSREKEYKRFSLCFQKRRINLWFGSGIFDGTCGRICAEFRLKLPGGFHLPLSLCVDRIIPYDTSSEEVSECYATECFEQIGACQISAEMIAGKILSGNSQLFKSDERYTYECIYHCHEMIGRERTEEIGESYGQND